tara:strand:- start:281 stop:856 length:576 start_codon:yes stop_codon:yes gene_type:complete
MRIVAGRHKGRKIEAPEGRDIRPTSDRARESIFNILNHRGWGPGGTSPVAGARVLDAFCGTGALGLEALSRGAAHATFLDKSRVALAVCRANIGSLGETANASVLQGDALRPVRPGAPYALVFLDPPYREGLAGPALDALTAAGWLTESAICVVETAAKEDVVPESAFETLETRKYGAAKITILRRIADGA